MAVANVEKQFIKALRERLDGVIIDTESGFQQQLGSHNIHLFDLPVEDLDTFNLVIEPSGPGFPLETLGAGGGMEARTKVVYLNLSVYYEHSDSNTCKDVLLDLAWWLSDFMISNQKLGGASRITVLKGDYGFAEINPDKDDNNVTDENVHGVFVLPLIVEYRRT